MDALSEVLRAARLSGGIFLRAEFSEPWCLTSTIQASDCSAHLGPTDHVILYHYVVEGELTVQIADEDPAKFHPGQAVIFARNDRHNLSGREPAEAVPALDLARVPAPGELMEIEHGGGGAATRIVCGFLGGQGLAGNPLLSSLPAAIRYDTSTARSGPLVRTSLEFAANEVADGRPGTDAMLARISEMLFVEAVRAYVEDLPKDLGGWMEALRDRSVSKAIALIHRQPEEPWTVERLGRAVGASRSTLTDKFTRYLDCAPAEYLTKHRMMLAARELTSGNASIMTIAEQIGYGSEAAFSRAFKRFYGVSPSAWTGD
ncbi:MAG: AraC family transcriptional regulator [Proteobacteria bacterium]|nr:AraC family transcriptional regulator [Pseudomonadota bacterium]